MGSFVILSTEDHSVANNVIFVVRSQADMVRWEKQTYLQPSQLPVPLAFQTVEIVEKN